MMADPEEAEFLSRLGIILIISVVCSGLVAIGIVALAVMGVAHFVRWAGR